MQSCDYRGILRRLRRLGWEPVGSLLTGCEGDAFPAEILDLDTLLTPGGAYWLHVRRIDISRPALRVLVRHTTMRTAETILKELTEEVGPGHGVKPVGSYRAVRHEIVRELCLYDARFLDVVGEHSFVSHAGHTGNHAMGVESDSADVWRLGAQHVTAVWRERSDDPDVAGPMAHHVVYVALHEKKSRESSRRRLASALPPPPTPCGPPRCGLRQHALPWRRPQRPPPRKPVNPQTRVAATVWSAAAETPWCPESGRTARRGTASAPRK